MVFRLSLFIAFLCFGCNNSSFSGGTKEKKQKKTPALEQGLASLRTTDRFVSGESEQESTKVDVIFVVDTSGSMVEEKSMLENNLSNFTQQLIAKIGHNYQIYMIGSKFNFPNLNDNNIIKINQFVDSTNGLEIFYRFAKNDFPHQLPLRSDATKHAVFITDDNAVNFNAAKFKTEIPKLSLGELHVHGIIGLDLKKKTPSCSIFQVGDEYTNLASDFNYRGSIHDICDSDWKSLLENLASKIVSTTPTKNFILSKTADKNKILAITVNVNGTAVDPKGYHYSPAGNEVVFDEGYIPLAGSSIEIIYDYSN